MPYQLKLVSAATTIFVLLFLIITCAGCTDSRGRLISQVEPETVHSTMITDPMKAFDGMSNEKVISQLLKDVEQGKIKYDEAVKLQKELVKQRIDAIAEADRLTAELERERAIAQNKIDIATANANTENALKEARQQFEHEQERFANDQQAKVILYVTLLGIILLVGGAAWAFFGKDLKMGGSIAGAGALTILVASQIPFLGFPIRIFVCACLVILAIGLGFAVAMRIRMKLLTDKQAEAKWYEAMEAQAAGDKMRAALALEGSRVLEHVGEVKYDPSRVEPSSIAEKLLKAA